MTSGLLSCCGTRNIFILHAWFSLKLWIRESSGSNRLGANTDKFASPQPWKIANSHQSPRLWMCLPTSPLIEQSPTLHLVWPNMSLWKVMTFVQDYPVGLVRNNRLELKSSHLPFISVFQCFNLSLGHFFYRKLTSTQRFLKRPIFKGT